MKCFFIPSVVLVLALTGCGPRETAQAPAASKPYSERAEYKEQIACFAGLMSARTAMIELARADAAKSRVDLVSTVVKQSTSTCPSGRPFEVLLGEVACPVHGSLGTYTRVFTEILPSITEEKAHAAVEARLAEIKASTDLLNSLPATAR